jgi:DNA primase
MIKTKRLEKINNLALRYYIDHLNQSKQAQEYLYARISKKIADRYFIGYAPNGGLVQFLNKYDVQENDAKDTGLILLDYDGNAFERFTHRIMIPIIHAGRLVGFGGRTLGEETKKNPKYINSKSSLLYNKSEVLYGLWRARYAIDKLGYGFLVEGYFDVLGLANYKVHNCVGLCGTALTRDQAKQLKRYTDKIYVMLDGDDAGKTAAKKAKIVLKKERVYAGRVLLPKKLDPDEFVKKYGRKALNKVRIVK